MSSHDRVTVSVCLVCGSSELAPIAARTDGVAVLRCRTCSMGFVESYPRDILELYGDQYFHGSPGGETETGYGDYDATSAHSTRWAAHLVGLLCDSGDILDVGCASGDLLSRLAPGLGRFGVEPNRDMAQRCRAAGIEILAADILDPALREHGGRFAVATAVSVLEHLVDIAGAMRQLQRLLAPDGILVYEVPLVSERTDSGIWFRSSLEHIYYPTVQGMRGLVQSTFGRPGVGGEVLIEGYGPTFVGLVGNSDAASERAASAFERLIQGPVSALRQQAELAFRFLFDVVHAAKRGSDELALLARIDAGVLTREIRERLVALWRADVAAADTSAELRKYAAAVEEARDHYRTLAANWEKEAGLLQGMVTELKAWVAEVEGARDFHRDQAERWMAEAKKWGGRG